METQESSAERHNEAPTWRVRHIPAQIQGVNLAPFLRSLIGELDLHDLHIGSLAPDPEDHKKPPSQIATVQFLGKLPSCLLKRNERAFPVAGQSRAVVIDRSFIGFTPLNAVDSGQHELDVIAISGLASHPFGSWKQPYDGAHCKKVTFMWLRDQLPHDFANLRVLTYGYNTDLLKSESFQMIDDLALSFTHSLRTIGKSKVSTKPFVVLAHSLGGLVLKRAMCLLANCESTRESPILTKLRMVIFFGVPSRGMKTSHLLPMVSGQPNEALVSCLSEEDEDGYLGRLSSAFLGISCFRNTRLISAYETRRTKTAIEISPGKWVRNGEPVVLVSRDSAVLKSTQDVEDMFPIDRDHSNLVKFTEGDPYYYSVSEKLRDVVFTSDSWTTVAESLQSDSVIKSSVTNLDSQAQEEAQIEGVWNLCGIPALIKQLVSLQSLNFLEKNRRLESIATSHSRSFEWISETKPGLKVWLGNDAPLFWIRGKAGSGKSTLMKYLYSLLNAENHRNTFHITNRMHHSWYFFNQRGTILQKSFEGLLRSLLYELGRKSESCAKVIKDFYFAKEEKYRDVWSEDDLLELFNIVQTRAELGSGLILFLDALDEYHGSADNIADFIYGLSNARNTSNNCLKVKICFSSRPWDVFMRRFSHCEGISLQDWTQRDIELYTNDQLLGLQIFQNQVSSKIGDVVKNIVRRSQGIFLWVRLVIEELANRPIQSNIEITEALENIPSELEEYYDWAVQRIDRRHRREAFVLLELVLRSQIDVEVSHLLGASQCAESKTLQEAEIRLNLLREGQTNIKERNMNFENLCGGLLEVYEQQMLSGPSIQYIRFIHQTAKDYAGRLEASKLILQDVHMLVPGNGHLFWLKYYFTNNERLGEHYLPAESQEIGYHAHLNESTTGHHCGEFLDSVPDEFFQETFGLRNRLHFAFSADLRIFVAWKIGQCQMDTQQSSVNLKKELEETLCEFCFSGLHYKTPIANSYNVGAMVRLLAAYGVDIGPSQIYHIYESLFVKDTVSYMSDSQNVLSPVPTEETKLQLVQAFLEAMNDPDIEICTSSTAFQYVQNAQTSHIETMSLIAPCRPLHVYSGDMVKLLLRYSADPNSKDKLGNTPLDHQILRIEQAVLVIKLVVDETTKLPRLEDLLANIEATVSVQLQTTLALVSAGARLSPTVRERFAGERFFNRDSLRTILLQSGEESAQFVHLIDTAGALPGSFSDEQSGGLERIKEVIRTRARIAYERQQKRDGNMAPVRWNWNRIIGRRLPLILFPQGFDDHQSTEPGDSFAAREVPVLTRGSRAKKRPLSFT